ncbi:MAG: alpha-E domain-containing protein [Mediterranea sp.]|nr:alpha-E domain-containing protein [Mediterranea sp.]
MMMCYAIPATKANRLYWLGRYAERVYISLHLLRRYYDRLIDGDPKDYEAYYKKLDINNDYASNETFHLAQMYDPQSPCSLMAGLESANDNAIVLREEIKSESLSYIQMSLCLLKESAAKREKNITALQPITDYLLAFFGSIDERVFDERIRNLIKMGKLVENLDLHVRFDYPFYRIEEAYESLKHCSEVEDGIFDAIILQRLDELVQEELYTARDADYKNRLLKYLNHLVLL